MEPSPKLWLSEAEQGLWRRLVATEAKVRDRLDGQLRTAHGLSLAEYAVLVHLSEAPGQELRMSELADCLILSRSGLTRRVEAMEKKGWVARHACPRDGRGCMARLTPTGQKLLNEAAPTHVRGVRRYLIDTLDSLDGLSEGLSRIESALEEG